MLAYSRDQPDVSHPKVSAHQSDRESGPAARTVWTCPDRRAPRQNYRPQSAELRPLSRRWTGSRAASWSSRPARGFSVPDMTPHCCRRATFQPHHLSDAGVRPSLSPHQLADRALNWPTGCCSPRPPDPRSARPGPARLLLREPAGAPQRGSHQRRAVIPALQQEVVALQEHYSVVVRRHGDWITSGDSDPTAVRPFRSAR